MTNAPIDPVTYTLQILRTDYRRPVRRNHKKFHASAMQAARRDIVAGYSPEIARACNPVHESCRCYSSQARFRSVIKLIRPMRRNENRENQVLNIPRLLFSSEFDETAKHKWQRNIYKYHGYFILVYLFKSRILKTHDYRRSFSFSSSEI